jgi:hypothetical protein
MLFADNRFCPKGMSIFLCRRLSGKEKKDEPSLRPLRLCGKIFSIRFSSVLSSVSLNRVAAKRNPIYGVERKHFHVFLLDAEQLE